MGTAPHTQLLKGGFVWTQTGGGQDAEAGDENDMLKGK